MKKSIEENQIVTVNCNDNFVDGAAVKRVGEISFNLCNKYLDDIILIDEGEICQNILDLKNNASIIVEPAGAMSIGVLNKYKKIIKNKNIGCIVCGGSS